MDSIPFAHLQVNGTPVTPLDDVEYAIVPELEQPVWPRSNAVDVGGVPGFMLNGPTLGRGVFAVYVRVNSAPLHPVILAGYITLT